MKIDIFWGDLNDSLATQEALESRYLRIGHRFYIDNGYIALRKLTPLVCIRVDTHTRLILLCSRIPQTILLPVMCDRATYAFIPFE